MNGFRQLRAIAALTLGTSSALSLVTASTLLAAPQQITRHDSAGVEIVTVPGAMLDGLPEWKLSAQPTLVIGGAGAEGPYLFDNLMAAARLPDGRIVVADGLLNAGANLQGGEVRFFNADGRHALTAGGETGAELRFSSNVRFLSVHERGLLVWDLLQARVTVVDTTGKLLESSPLNRTACSPLPPFASCTPIGALANGTLAAIAVNPPQLGGGGEPGRVQPPLPYVLPSRTMFGLYRGEALTQIDALEGPTRVYFRESAASIVRLNLPRAFGPNPVMAVGRRSLAIGDGTHFEIRLRDENRLTRVLRVDRKAVPVTPAAVALFRSADARHPGLLGALPASDSIPHFGALRLDDADRLWVIDYLADTSGSRGATIFDATGRPIARIALPTTLTIHQIGADYVLASEAVTVAGSPAPSAPATRRVVMYKIETGGS